MPRHYITAVNKDNLQNQRHTKAKDNIHGRSLGQGLMLPRWQGQGAKILSSKTFVNAMIHYILLCKIYKWHLAI